MKRLTGWALALGLLLVPGCSATEVSLSPAIRPDLTLGIGYETVKDPETDWVALAAHLTEAQATGVTISVGRPEWVLFDWAGHEDAWASDGEDLVAAAISALDAGADGSRELTLVIDTLAPLMIAEDPQLAAIGPDGEASDSFPGAAALATGPVGDQIVALCETTAERYRPDRIALTELMIDNSFSDDDFELWQEMTGNHDWPRDEGGDIDTDADEIAQWRSAVISGLVNRCAQAAAEHDVALDMDVRANWRDPSGDRALSGHIYTELIKVTDYLTVWNYFALSGRDPSYSEQLTAGLAETLGDDLDAVTMCVGLWTNGDEATGADRDNALSPADMVAGLAASATNGVRTVSVIPVSMMTDEHWAALIEWRANT